MKHIHSMATITFSLLALLFCVCIVSPIFASGSSLPNSVPSLNIYEDDTTPLTNGAVNDPKIVMVLDSSGSMDPIRDDIIGSVNTFLEQQKKEPESNNTTFSLLQFGSELRWIYSDQLLTEIKPLTADQYQVTGRTPLYDALGDAITRFDYYRDIIMAIITDGEENASRRFTQEKVKEMMAKKKSDANWVFVYLSCDEAGFAAGRDLGVSSNQQVYKGELGEILSSSMSASVSHHRKENYEARQQQSELASEKADL